MTFFFHVWLKVHGRPYNGVGKHGTSFHSYKYQQPAQGWRREFFKKNYLESGRHRK
jgi:hypothetical protein